MAHICNNCDREYTTAFNLRRHMRLAHGAAQTGGYWDRQRSLAVNSDGQQSDEDASADGGGGEVDEEEEEEEEEEQEEGNEGEEDESHDAWDCLFPCLQQKEVDFYLTANKAKHDLQKAGVSDSIATERGSAMFFKLLFAELKQCFKEHLLKSIALRRDSIYKAILSDMKESDKSFETAFAEAWRHNKQSIIDDVLLPNFPSSTVREKEDESLAGESDEDDVSVEEPRL
jgi:hypothetical protein